MMKDVAGKVGLNIAGSSISDSDADYLGVVKFLTVPKAQQDAAAFKGKDVAAIKALEDNALRQIADGMISAKTARNFDSLSNAQKEFYFRK